MDTIDTQPTNTEPRTAETPLIVDLGAYEGPLDVLLTLSRAQKVDLRHISILALAEQYLLFVEQAKKLRLEVAADYLVMAAWLAFLKSRLLLPPEPGEDGPTPDELAQHLAFQLERLQAMRDVAARLMARDRLGRDVFGRGMTEVHGKIRHIRYNATLIDLLQGYARIRTKDEFRPFVFDRERTMTMDEALDRMRGYIGFVGDWTDISSFLPDGWGENADMWRSATAANFAAALQLTKEGAVSIRQNETFAPIQVRSNADE